ncbi:SusD/RagB family nutrient-binding outer membrane lipoprotein [Terrimonas pollutisoli]|uniref:SusD/RagB family nutrient-binding outer membrane lipoprotein n=1 Tax=Terrimonas pollutisoli TaxID=3034147 RepID=UPI0023EC227C|nr:SusD/RagB family nutrient-binding outer membrane lipoprotein [Terrimonas sp. H1YJ31]
MKLKYLSGALLALVIAGTACKKQKFADYYIDPRTVDKATIEKQFAGAVGSTMEFTMYKYWNYFVILQNTALHYTQVVGWQNFEKQYEPGAAAVGDRWGWYYGFVAQYKDFLKVYNSAPQEEQTEKRIYKIAADIFFYDQTQKVVDLHGDIPWTEAGLLSTNSGDYKASFAKYDKATDIYTKMLDDLKAYADELNTLSVPASVTGVMKIQDFINKGDLSLWKKYCNSLRVRMLTRVSGVAAFQARSNTELAAIVADPSKYPVCTTNADNILLRVVTLSNSPVNSDLYSGIIGWGNNDRANKGMIDTLQNNNDPRLRALFQPGALSAPKYVGLDPMLDPSTQGQYLAKDTIARYNFSTISKNRFLPGILITAAETQLLLAEYYLKANNDAAAKTAYENAVKQSIDFFFWLRTISDNNETAVTPVTDAEKNAYLASNIAWAGTTAKKMELIAIQKWINYNVLQPLEGWAELRRTNLPVLTFRNDNGSTLAPLPPARWYYPDNERTYNTANYEAVKGTDNLSTKLFWDN